MKYINFSIPIRFVVSLICTAFFGGLAALALLVWTLTLGGFDGKMASDELMSQFEKQLRKIWVDA